MRFAKYLLIILLFTPVVYAVPTYIGIDTLYGYYSNGTGLDRNFNISYQWYNHSSAGSLLYNFTADSTYVNGVTSTPVFNLNATFFYDNPLTYLGISINGTNLTTRYNLSTVPYCFVATLALSTKGLSYTNITNPPWLRNGTDADFNRVNISFLNVTNVTANDLTVDNDARFDGNFTTTCLHCEGNDTYFHGDGHFEGNVTAPNIEVMERLIVHGNSSCTGVATACGAFSDRASCGWTIFDGQRGCYWWFGSCLGTATTCDSISTTVCEEQSGCSLSSETGFSFGAGGFEGDIAFNGHVNFTKNITVFGTDNDIPLGASNITGVPWTRNYTNVYFNSIFSASLDNNISLGWGNLTGVPAFVSNNTNVNFIGVNASSVNSTYYYGNGTYLTDVLHSNLSLQPRLGNSSNITCDDVSCSINMSIPVDTQFVNGSDIIVRNLSVSQNLTLNQYPSCIVVKTNAGGAVYCGADLYNETAQLWVNLINNTLIKEYNISWFWDKVINGTLQLSLTNSSNITCSGTQCSVNISIVDTHNESQQLWNNVINYTLIHDFNISWFWSKVINGTVQLSLTNSSNITCSGTQCWYNGSMSSYDDSNVRASILTNITALNESVKLWVYNGSLQPKLGNSSNISCTDTQCWFNGTLTGFADTHNESQEIWNNVINYTLIHDFNTSWVDRIVDNNTVIRAGNSSWVNKILDNDTVVRQHNVSWFWNVVTNGSLETNITQQVCSGTQKFSGYNEGTFTCSADTDTQFVNGSDIIVRNASVSQNFTLNQKPNCQVMKTNEGGAVYCGLDLYNETPQLWLNLINSTLIKDYNWSWVQKQFNGSTNISVVNGIISVNASIGGDISGALSTLEVADQSHLHHALNITNVPWIANLTDVTTAKLNVTDESIHTDDQRDYYGTDKDVYLVFNTTIGAFVIG